jgi:hypothetical protein
MGSVTKYVLDSMLDDRQEGYRDDAPLREVHDGRSYTEQRFRLL